MFRSIHCLEDVVAWRLCTGCGTCFSACERGAVDLVNWIEEGIRPRFAVERCQECRDCLEVCPGYTVAAESTGDSHVSARSRSRDFGTVLELWEGYALDPEIRFKGSSGGLLSALSLHCIENEDMDFVLHTGMDPERPYLSRTVASRTRQEVLARSGSRYTPASPCDGLKAIEASARSCLFIGKPCDVAGVQLLRRRRPQLDSKLGLLLTFFCAGTPSTLGTLELLDLLGAPRNGLKGLRYRGEGWPGRFKVLFGNHREEKSLDYQSSWGRLAGYRPLRCHLCPDGFGRSADLSCGDAWHLLDAAGDHGRSIVVVRTKRGQEVLGRARSAGLVELEPLATADLLRAQQSLLERQRYLFGRLSCLKLMDIPVPRYRGFSLFRNWLLLPAAGKVKSVLGTVRRVLARGWWRARIPPW